MTSRSDRIEQIFQRVEEESERRAQAEHAERSDPTQNVLTMISPAAAATLRVPRERRRGSVTVSRFGQSAESSPEASDKPCGTPTSVSFIVQKTGFYQAQTQTGSADSLASATDDAGAHDHVDEEQFIQVENIAGKQSISKAISRRLSRSKTRSRDVLSSANSSVIIGVSVEEATVEHEAHDDAEGRAGTSVAYCPATLPRRESRGSMAGEKGERGAAGGWLGKAKGLTHKFRRKSIPVLSQTSS
ncbi:hypothetical protein AcV5_002208 [Taiwanofungus camphoratus]|nr:hypothetical protein AcV5_002208 [Antrodia cinnamomea]